MTSNDTHPLDIKVMRETAAILLEPDAAPEVLAPPPTELETLIPLLRSQLEWLAPEVEHAAGKLDKNSVPRYCALACVGEARGKLRAKPNPGPGGDAAYARKLARVLHALCDHYENFGGPA